MKILAADDEILQLSKLVRSLGKVVPFAEIYTFSDSAILMQWIECGGGTDVDVAFLDIGMGAVSGLRVAGKLQSLHPRINIIFVTGHPEYAVDAFALHASGYISKPATEEKLRTELEHLRYPMPKPPCAKKLRVKCFGYFEATVDGEPLKYKREKSRELLAFLVDHRGAVCTPREICAALWEADKFDYLRQLTKDLRQTLRAVGAEDVFVTRFKEYYIDPSRIECDYYDYLTDEPNAVKAFHGEYMTQYGWAEGTLSALLFPRQREAENNRSFLQLT